MLHDHWRAAALGLALALTAALAGGDPAPAAQRRRGGPPPDLSAGAVPYDGRYTFARLRYEMSDLGGFGRRRGFSREPPWSHDYPTAERCLMKILKSVTTTDPYMGPHGGSIIALGDPELFKYPIAYMSEPGYWTQTDAEAENLRRYLQKGGFLIFDDFRGGDLYNFEEQFARVLPQARRVQLDASHPIFHAFFDINPAAFVQMYDRGQAIFYGVFEDNDTSKRLIAIADFNNDIGEYWEYSETGYNPIDLTNDAFKYGVNYVVYGMTH